MLLAFTYMVIRTLSPLLVPDDRREIAKDLKLIVLRYERFLRVETAQPKKR